MARGGVFKRGERETWQHGKGVNVKPFHAGARKVSVLHEKK